MATVHFVYPHRRRISAPHSIGRKLGALLARRYDVVQYDLYARAAIRPRTGDVLLGHPVPSPLSCFTRNARRRGWRRVIMMYPFNGHPRDMAFLLRVLPSCDRFLAITGRYWFDRAREDFPSWFPQMSHLDLAVDRSDFPQVKRAFSPPGRRKFLYIGNLARAKNVGYLSDIAHACSNMDFAWFGAGGAIPGVKSLGYADFASPTVQALVAEHDFLLTVGSNDANPTTILEGMAWGLIPVCTPQSGYSQFPGVFNVPLGNVSGAVRELTRLQGLPSDELMKIQQANFDQLDHHFNWERVYCDVVSAIEGPIGAPLMPSTVERAARLVDEIRSDGFWLRPSQLRTVARQSAADALRDFGLLPRVT